MSKSNDPKGAVQASLYRGDTDKLVPREKLPEDLQKLVDDDSLLEQIYEGTFVFRQSRSTCPFFLLINTQG